MPSGRMVAFEWCELAWSGVLSSREAVSVITAIVSDPTEARLALEIRSSHTGMRFLLGAEAQHRRRLARLVGVAVTPPSEPRAAIDTGRRLRLSTPHRPLATDQMEVTAETILTALSAVRKLGEELVIQLLLGRHLPSQVVPSSAAAPSRLLDLLLGTAKADDKLDSEARTALTQKVAVPGFRAEVRIGVSAATPGRRRSLALGVLGALRRLEAPGVRLWLDPLPAGRLGRNKALCWPWYFRLRLNAHEVAALAALPVADSKTTTGLPGLPPPHPRQLAPERQLPRPGKNRIIVAEPTAPGVSGVLTRTTDALLRHLHIAGPTGTGKSVLLQHLALQDMAAERGVIVMDPKGDLINDLLARIPEVRQGDVVVLDPLADHIVGLNPLAASGDSSSAEVRADAVLSIFADMFGSALGPRTTDVLHASLLTLAHRDDASLVQIPRLLTDPAFRAPRIARMLDDIALGPFWAWYQGLRDTERTAVIAPLMNKLRAVLLKPSVRRVLGQVEPRFSISEVFTERKILLIPLPVASLGAEGAKLLGSLVTAQIWDAARSRTSIPSSRRHPVSVVLDECQTFLGYQTDIADALATSRSYGVGWTLAHQYLGQLPSGLRDAVLTNCRSRVVFQTSHTDAKTFADQTSGTSQLQAEDFTSLAAFHAYISLYDHGQTQSFVSGRTLPPPPATTDPRILRAASTARYGRSAADIEAGFTKSGNTGDPGRDNTRPADGAGSSPTPGRLPRRRASCSDGAASDRVSGRPTGRDSAAASEPAGQRQKAPELPNATPADPATAPTPEQAGGGPS